MASNGDKNEFLFCRLLGRPGKEDYVSPQAGTATSLNLSFHICKIRNHNASLVEVDDHTKEHMGSAGTAHSQSPIPMASQAEDLTSPPTEAQTPRSCRITNTRRNSLKCLWIRKQ